MHVDEGTAELEPVQTLLPDLSPLTATRHLRHSQLPHTSQTTNPHADTPGPLSVPNRSCDPIPHSLTAHPGRPRPPLGTRCTPARRPLLQRAPAPPRVAPGCPHPPRRCCQLLLLSAPGQQVMKPKSAASATRAGEATRA